MITRIRLTNFKAWRELQVRFATVTGVFGANSGDAKFLAVAVKADATIVNATDSDWAEHRALTDRLGVDVRQLCPQHATRPKMPRGDHGSP